MRADKEQAPVLVVAGDPSLRRSLEAALADGRRIVNLAPEALRERSRWIDAVAAVAVLDGSQGEAGLERLEPLRELPAARSLVLVTRKAPEELIDAALGRLRPAQVLPHPAPAALLRYALERVLPAEATGQGARPQHRRAPALLGVSAAIREILSQVRRVAPTRVPVLVLGETGTGKELVARAIHEESPRANHPFVAINCGALPEALLESELFGFEKGAFTGATHTKRGLFEQAEGGTIFLDEIGDMPLALQVKLLRVLETGEVRALGATQARWVDVRLVSATHQDLEAAIQDGSFREDLYYRLNTVTLYVPPLRRRPVDIPFLAQHFAEEFGDVNARRILLGEDFVAALARHSFPGNVRELRNAVERAITLAAPDETVSERHLPPGFGPGPLLPTSGTLRDRVEALEVQTIRDALEKSGGNRTRAAEALGLSRLGLRQKMRRLGLEPGRRR